MAQSTARNLDEGYDRGSLARAGKTPDWLVGWTSLFWGSALVMGANIFLWVWDYKFAFTAGLYSASPEVPLPYRGLFLGGVIVRGVVTGLWGGGLVRSGPPLEGPAFSPPPEARRDA